MTLIFPMRPASLSAAIVFFMELMVVVRRQDRANMRAFSAFRVATNFSGATSQPKIDHFKPRPFEHHGHDILSDIMKVALYRP